MNNKKGFTIIELIVVIAIIAVLAAIVLVNVTQYINKGKDAAAEGNLATLMTNASVFFADSTKGNGAYTLFTADPTYTSIATALTNAGYTISFTCTGSSTCDTAAHSSGWCASVTMKADSTKSYCVDSTGAKYLSTTSVCNLTTNEGTCHS